MDCPTSEDYVRLVNVLNSDVPKEDKEKCFEAYAKKAVACNCHFCVKNLFTLRYIKEREESRCSRRDI